MRGTYRLGILAASTALLAIGLVLTLLAGRRTLGEVPDSSVSDAAVASTEAEGLAALGTSTTKEAGAETSIELVATPGEIRGVLLDPEGKPVRGVIEMSWWYASSGAIGRRDGSSVPTDRVGRFQWQPRTLAVPFWARPRETDRHWAEGVQATPGGEPLVIRLRDRPTVRVTVLDSAGSPVVGAGVGASLLESTRPLRPLTDETIAASMKEVPIYSHAKTDARGVAWLAHPGLERDCRLSAGYGGIDRDDVGSLVVERWKPSDCTVRLPASYVVDGTVRDAAGRPFEEGIVAYRTSESGRWETADIKYDGSFCTARLEGGSVELEARIPDVVPPSASTGRIVAAGSRDVMLTVDLGAELVVQFAEFPPISRGRMACLTSEPWTERSRPALAEVDKEGTCRFRGLRPGSAYTVYLPEVMSQTEDRVPRIAYRPHVTAASSPVRIELIDALEIRGTLDGGALSAAYREDASSAVVRVHDRGVFVEGTSRMDGFVVGGLPPGEWTLNGDFQQREWVNGKAANVYSTAREVVPAGSTGVRLKLGAMTPGLGPVARGE